MNKEIFLRDLRRFLADIPEEEREQALHYYEDYFEDAGPENEQKVIEELGSPIDIAKQIMASNQENIAYGEGSHFRQTTDYPNPRSNVYSSGTRSEAGENQKKSWTQDSGKVTLVILFAVLAIPVGLPVLSTLLGVFAALLAAIASLLCAGFGVGTALAVAGTVTIAGAIAIGVASGIASALVTAGVGLILFSIGIFLFYFSIVFCMKFFPAAFHALGNCFRLIRNKVKAFFN